MNTTSRKRAIAEFCRECICDPHEPGNWRQQVEACPSTRCPLYHFRPVSRGERKIAPERTATARRR